MKEAVVENYLAQRVQGMGGEVRKVKWIGRRGAPDRLVLFGSRAKILKPVCIWVELKRPGEKPEPHQAREHERLRDAGMRVAVIDTLGGVDTFLESLYHNEDEWQC